MAEYEFEGGVGQSGIEVLTEGKRTIVAIYCRLDWGMWESDDFGDDDDDTEEIMINDSLLSLLVDIRKQLIQGDFRALYEVWNVYGWDDDDEFAPPVPHKKKTGKDTLCMLSEMLTTD